LKHLVSGGDAARVRLKSPLCDDHVCELVGKVDVRHFKKAGVDAAKPLNARSTDNRITRIDRFDKIVLA
jgi:hypothetical protein